VEQLAQIAFWVRTWKRLLSVSDTERWLQMAQTQADIAALAPASPGAMIASWLALLAYQNAATVASFHGSSYALSGAELESVRSNIDRLSPSLRQPARRIVDSFLTTTR
jgi:hypothetical protein